MDEKKIIGFLVAVIVIFAILSQPGPPPLAIGFIDAYQGLKPSFAAILFKNYWYTSTQYGPNENHKFCDYCDPQTASAHEFFDRINFDPDIMDSHMPNIGASMQPIASDPDYGVKTYGPWRIKIGEETVTESNATHEWTTTIETYKEYQIDRHRCEWAVNLWLSGGYYEATMAGDEHTYYDTEVWIMFQQNPFTYFVDAPDEVYFAPAKIQLANLEWWAYDKNGKLSQAESTLVNLQDLIPEAVGDTMGVYYELGGTDVDIEQELLTYEGAKLDPNLFRRDYWSKISLQTFKPYSYWDIYPLGWSYYFPSAKLKLEMFVFVVGSWTVKLEKGEVIELEPHQPGRYEPGPISLWAQLVDGWNDLWYGVSQWLANPFNVAGLTGVIVIMAVLVVAALVVLRAPWLLPSRRRKGGKP